MGRLRRKKPIWARKKQKADSRPDSRNPVVEQKGVPTDAGDKRIVKFARPESNSVVKPEGRAFRPAFAAKATQFLREAKIEFKKVTWPSRKETLASTGVVIVLVIIISAFLGLVDMGLSSLIRLVLG